jgi:GNAT superfamily N-acetyltransferase
VFLRPDGGTFTRNPADVDPRVDVYASVTGELGPWLDAGFVVHRRENRYIVPTTTATDAAPPAGIRSSPPTAGEHRLRELDDLLRQDVPGTDGWHWAEADFCDDTWKNPHFDPAVYVVAVDEVRDGYVGIARIWLRAAGAHPGFVGVGREYRRRGIGAALLGRVFAVLRARGVWDVTTEIDVRECRLARADRAARRASRRREHRGRP